jgi:trehalose 6-phosphate phosphatase
MVDRNQALQPAQAAGAKPQQGAAAFMSQVDTLVSMRYGRGMLIPDLPDRASAIFLDFDGTLVDIAAQPDAVVVEPGLPELLVRLSGLLGGALALVSGRPLADIDRHLGLEAPLPAAGVHGTERRGSDGFVRRIAVGALEQPAALIDALVARHPALLVERKPGAIALHYRQAPELEDLCIETLSAAMQSAEGMVLMRGKQVVELKPRRASKGMAVRSFLDERPFRHRRPWFFGDDVTDEGAFELVQSLGGVAVKIGEGETLAAHHLPDPAALREWLVRAADHLAGLRVERVAT